MEYPTYAHTAAGLNATARDLARFVAAVASGEVLGKAFRRAMWTPVQLADGNTFRFGPGTTGFGLGWQVDTHREQPWVAMSGGASVAFRHYPREALTVVILTNCQGADPDGLVEAVANVYLAGDEP